MARELAHLDRVALEFTTSLPAAIAGDELMLHWQPLVDLEDLSIIGLEALVRWNHPERGLLLPGAFLPFAEATGLITGVDTWVAAAVTRQRLRWQAQGLDPYVGFNVTPSFARQRETLRGLGVRVAQGFLLGRPVPADELLDRLRASPPSQLVLDVAPPATPVRTAVPASSPLSEDGSPTVA